MPLRLFNCTTGQLETRSNGGANVLCVTGNHSGWYMEPVCDLSHVDWDMRNNGDLVCIKCGAVAARGVGEEGIWWTGPNIIWYMAQHPDQEYDDSLTVYKQQAERLTARWNQVNA